MKRVQPTIRGNTEGDEVIDMKTHRRTSAAAWFAAGALASCAAFAAILWLWVVPAMDAALAAVQGAVA